MRTIDPSLLLMLLEILLKHGEGHRAVVTLRSSALLFNDPDRLKEGLYFGILLSPNLISLTVLARRPLK